MLSFTFSESGGGWGGAQLLLISFATTRLHEFAMEVSTEWKMEGALTPVPQPWDWGSRLGISAPPPPQQTQIFRIFCLGLGGGTKVFYPRRPDYRRFKIPSFTSPGHTQSLVCAPGPHFLSAELQCFPNYAMLAISSNA